MVIVSGESRATSVGRLTTSVFWFLTRMPNRRPYSVLTIDCTVEASRPA